MNQSKIMWRLVLKLVVLAAVLLGASTAVAADDDFTKNQELLIELAQARVLPASVSASWRKQLAGVAAQFGKGQHDKARASWKQFVEAANGSQMNETDFDFVQRWVARQAHLLPKKQLDTLAYKIGQQRALAQSLAAHRAKLKAVGATLQKQTIVIEIVRVDGEKLVKKGTRTVNRDQLNAEMRELDSAREDIKSKRDELKTKLQAMDQSANQTLQALVAVVKTMSEIRSSSSKSVGF